MSLYGGYRVIPVAQIQAYKEELDRIYKTAKASLSNFKRTSTAYKDLMKSRRELLAAQDFWPEYRKYRALYPISPAQKAKYDETRRRYYRLKHPNPQPRIHYDMPPSLVNIMRGLPAEGLKREPQATLADLAEAAAAEMAP